jgi:hypothetical protein
MGDLLCFCKNLSGADPGNTNFSKIKDNPNINKNESNLNTSHKNIPFENKIDDNQKNNINLYQKEDFETINKINNMRMSPEDYNRASNEKDNVNDIFEALGNENNNKVKLNYNTDLIKKIRNYIYSNQTFEQNSIKNIICDVTKKSINKFYINENIDKKNEEVEKKIINLFENNDKDMKNILTDYSDIVIVTVPYGDNDKKTYYILYSLK